MKRLTDEAHRLGDGLRDVLDPRLRL